MAQRRGGQLDALSPKQHDRQSRCWINWERADHARRKAPDFWTHVILKGRVTPSCSVTDTYPGGEDYSGLFRQLDVTAEVTARKANTPIFVGEARASLMALIWQLPLDIALREVTRD